ncbi:MAG: sigma 54-interacting transcriptional regulator [Acidobacteria bacterium]|nr:sigma 54-interacting transcriptional regulator [Acidobacteriota bacterium]
MSSQQIPWYKAFDKSNKREQNRSPLSIVIAQAEAAFESGQYKELIQLIEKTLAQKIADLEQEVILRCLLSEALCELSFYNEAATAIEIYETKLASLPNKLKAEVLLRIGATSSWRAQYPKAIAKLNEAVLIFTVLADREGITRGYFELSLLYININEYAIARDYLNRAYTDSEHLANRRLTAQIFLRLGMVDHYEGDFASAKSHYSNGLKLVEGTKAYRLLGSLQMNLANTLFLEQRGATQKIISLYEQALENFKLLNNSHFIAHCYNNLGDSLLRFGMWERAKNFLTEAIELARSANYSHSESLALITLAELKLRCGDLTGARHLLTPAIKIAEQTDKSVLAYAKRVYGYTYTSGNPAALKSFNSSLHLANSVGEHNEIAFALLALVDYYLARQEYEQARNFLKQAQERLNQKPSPYISGFAQRMTGVLKSLEKMPTEAIQHINASISIFTTVGDKYELGRSHLDLAQILINNEIFDTASTHIAQAQEILFELKAQPEIIRAERLKESLKELQLVNATKASSTTEKISELALFKRLSQACITQEILLEEFAVITFESFPLERLLIFCPFAESQTFLISHGCFQTEAIQLRNRIITSDKKYSESGRLIKLLGNHYQGIYLYFEVKSGNFSFLEQERWELFLEFLKLGLENCALRSSSQIKPSINLLPQNLDTPNTLIEGFVYSSPIMCRVIEQIKKIRTSEVTVLITGESGTGKELIARAIHAESARCEGAFVAFNCAATPRELIESQLFGHRRGSFTGATSNYLGVIRNAKAGTLFLDEIGDLSLDLQPKLLRFLEAGEIQPLGEGRPLKVDVRVIAATNADLGRSVSERRFREDLYHRLNIIRIHIPPLRERLEEIPMLLRYYLSYFSTRYPEKQISFSEAAINALQSYHWPGNVRQLRNEIERLITYSVKGDVISVSDLSPDIRQQVSLSVVPILGKASVNSTEPTKVVDIFQPTPKKLKDVVRPVEKELILTSFKRNKGNFSKVAKELGISRRGLRLKIDSLGIEFENIRYK